MISRVGRCFSLLAPLCGRVHNIHKQPIQLGVFANAFLQQYKFYSTEKLTAPITPASTLPVSASVTDSEKWTASVDWNNKENQRAYLDWLGNQFSYKQLSDWYGVKLEDFSATKGGQALLKLYSHPSISIQKVYPEHEWEMWKFNCQSDSYWNSVFHRKAYCKWLGAQLGVKKHEDWYQITMPQFVTHFGEGLMKLYRGSVPAAVRGMHDWNHEWHNWRFKDLPRDYWKKKTNQKEYMVWLGKHLGLKSTEDLYKITAKSFEDNHGAGMLAEYKGSAADAVCSVYSNLKLDKSRFQK